MVNNMSEEIKHKKYTGMSSFIPKGRTKRRYKFMYKRRLYQKSFEGTKKQCDEQFKLWKENKLKTLKDRPFDGSKTWSFFRAAYLSYIVNKTDKKTGRKYYKPRTIEEYGYAFNKFETLAKITYVNDLTLDIIRKVRAQLEEEASQKGCDNYGANKTLRCIYTALKWGIDRGIVPDISISALSLLDVSEVEVSTFSTRQIELLLKYSSPKWRVAILLGFDSGCRPEEVYNMLIRDLDLKEGFGEIVHHEEDKKSGIREWYPKRDKERPIRLFPRFIKEMKALNPKGPYLLTNRWGEPYNDDNFSKKFQKHIEAVNRKIASYEDDPVKIVGTFKMLRKNHVTNLQIEGASEDEAAASAGHSDKKVTKKNYTNAKDEALKRAKMSRQKEKLKEFDKFFTELNY